MYVYCQNKEVQVSVIIEIFFQFILLKTNLNNFCLNICTCDINIVDIIQNSTIMKKYLKYDFEDYLKSYKDLTEILRSYLKTTTNTSIILSKKEVKYKTKLITVIVSKYPVQHYTV